MSESSDGRSAEPRATSVIDNALAVLRCFSADEPLLGVTEISHRVGLHKSTVSRLLVTLENSHLVERDSLSRQYRLGMGLLAVAAPLLASLDVRRVAYPHMQELTAQTRETCALLLWNGYESVCVEECLSPQAIKHTMPLGTRYATAYSASVQLFLAEHPHERAGSLLRSGAIELTDPTPQRIDSYTRELATVRETGTALNHGKTSVDEVGLSAGVRDHRGELVAALTIAAPRFRVSEHHAHALGEAVLDAARRISQRLGHAPAR